MHTENRLSMEAAPEEVFALAAEISRWPERLGHYRYVRVRSALAEDGPSGRTIRADMSARRGMIPVRWQSTQIREPERGIIRYRHVGGITRGMEVEWHIVPRSGGCDVRIVHDLDRPRGVLRLPGARWIAGELFVRPIADRTLAGIARLAAGGSA